MEKNIIPVLLGADLNCYSVARAFHEAFGVTSYAFGRYASGETSHSSIISFKTVKELDRESVMLEVLVGFAKKHSADELYLIACTDGYQRAVIKNRDFLQKYYFCVCPSADIEKKLRTKEAFLEACREYSLPCPKTAVMKKGDEIPDDLGFSYPVIIKPSDSAAYWRTPFEGMKKVYTAHDGSEARNIIGDIYSAGYSGSMILQELIPGGDSAVYVLTAYCDTQSIVRMLCMGHVLLGEHTPKGLGNHVAVITEYHPSFMKKISDFLEKIKYTGFANFDIMLDPRDGEFKLLEVNLRQGRSNYYVTASGINIAELAVRDKRGDFTDEKYVCEKESFWHTVPKNIVYKMTEEAELVKKARELVKKGRSKTALFYARDMLRDPLRSAYVLIHNAHYYKKYRIHG